MTYVTITTWELADGADFGVSLRNVTEKRMPALLEMGATKVTLVRTSDRTTAAISEWPDKETRDAAMDLVETVRRKVHSVDGSRLTGELQGTVVAQI